MIVRDSARAVHSAVGDSIEVAIGGQARRLTITGITGYGSAGRIPGGSLAPFAPRTPRRRFGRAGYFDTVPGKAGARGPAPPPPRQGARRPPAPVEAAAAAHPPRP